MRLILIMSLTLASLALGAPPTVQERAKQLFTPLPAQFASKDNPLTKEKIALGKQLFFETRLSKNHDVSCNTCHDLTKYGVDGLPTSSGHRKQQGNRNAPTVYNAGNHLAQFWDGRAPTLEEQAKGPMLNPVEMAMADASTLEKMIASIPGYAPLFQKAFPGEANPITYDNMGKAIGAYERTLLTPSRFDRFLTGDNKALTGPEQAGLALFMDAGCTACHAGEGVGGSMYQKFGLVKPVKDLKDTGRFGLTKNEADRFVFKVPSLRNVEKTGPYFHDGSVKTLDGAVTSMADYQLGRTLKPDEVASLVAFLKALTGDLPKDLAPPKPLPAGKTTPPPDPS